jgi:Endoplasmic reticulum vesicle transporter
MSPVTVKFTQYEQSFLHFLVQLCAIIGGVFTIAGIADGLVHKGVRSIRKKYGKTPINSQ